MIFYICHYTCDEIGDEKRVSSPATQYKGKYIIDTLSQIQKDALEIVTPSETKKTKVVWGSTKQLADNVRIKSFISFNSKNKVVRILGHFCTGISFMIYLLRKIKSTDKVIVYHSLLLMPVVKILRAIKKCDLIFEVEEIYSDVLEDKKMRNREWDYLQIANGYIFPTVMLDKAVNVRQKPSVLVHGSYQIETQINSDRNREERIIHCVYAGTFDLRKGGALAAVLMTEYLPENYHVHILGFGNQSDTAYLKELIASTSDRSEAKVTFDGLLTGNEYIEFLQKCDIGLSTQNPNAAFNDTSFPSKILSYMANGLKVVSIRIPAVETSEIGAYVSYYDEQTAESIAKAVINANAIEEYDSRKIVSELDMGFKRNLKRLVYSLE